MANSSETKAKKLALKSLTVEELVNEIRLREEGMLTALEEKQKTLLEEAKSISKQIKALSMAKDIKSMPLVSMREDKKSRTHVSVSEKTLRERIVDILKAGPLAIKQVVTELERTGWKTSSKQPYYPVATALANTKTFVRVSKGVYALKEQLHAEPINADS